MYSKNISGKMYLFHSKITGKTLNKFRLKKSLAI